MRLIYLSLGLGSPVRVRLYEREQVGVQALPMLPGFLVQHRSELGRDAEVEGFVLACHGANVGRHHDGVKKFQQCHLGVAVTPYICAMVAHRIELRPTPEQAVYMARCAGTSRFVYNRLVAKQREDAKAGVKYSRKAMQHYATALRKEFPWMQEVSGRCAWEPADQFHHAMERAFKKLGKFPSFKKKGQHETFRFSHPTQFKVDGRKVRIQGQRSFIAMRERIRFDGDVRSCSIRRIAGKWYATFLVKVQDTPSLQGSARKPIVAVDLGIKSLAVLSSGEVIPNPRALASKQALLARRQRQLSRKRKGSNRRAVAKQRVARLHKKVSDVRSAAQHALTTRLVRSFDTIVLEDLNVKGMVKNRSLAKAISDCGFGEIRRQVEYKAKWYGCTVIVAPRFFASSKTCSACGERKPMLLLSERTFKCACGNTMDRDLNAAMNLEQYGRHQASGDHKRAEEGSRTPSDRRIPVDAAKSVKSPLNALVL